MRTIRLILQWKIWIKLISGNCFETTQGEKIVILIKSHIKNPTDIYLHNQNLVKTVDGIIATEKIGDKL